jgi:predicted DNA-binding transcriptional regulator YafY
MGIFETLERIRIIHEAILHEETGTPEEFAERLHISKRHLYHLLDEYKDYGAKIEYDRIKCTYYYVNHIVILIKITD